MSKFDKFMLADPDDDQLHFEYVEPSDGWPEGGVHVWTKAAHGEVIITPQQVRELALRLLIWSEYGTKGIPSTDKPAKSS